MADEVLTLAEAAEELGVHYMTVYRYVRTGRLPATRVAGTWRIDPGDLSSVRRRAPVASAARRRRPAEKVAPQAGGAATSGDEPETGGGRAGAQLEARLVAGDEAGAWALMEAALASGTGPDVLLIDVLGPTLHSIGGHWADGRLSIVHEHRASVVATRLLGRLGARFTPRGVKRGAIVLAAPAGDLHALPVAMGANLLRWAGFEVVELGADTPGQALADAVAYEVAHSRPRPVVAGLVCTVAGSPLAAQAAIAEVRRTSPGVPLLLGGAAVTGAEHARGLGADDYTGKRGDDLVRAVEAVARQWD